MGESSVATTSILNPKYEKNVNEDIQDLSDEEKREISSNVNSIAFSLRVHPDDVYKALALLKQEGNLT